MPIRAVWSAVEDAKKKIQNLSVDELAAEIEQDEALLVVDLRCGIHAS